MRTDLKAGPVWIYDWQGGFRVREARLTLQTPTALHLYLGGRSLVIRASREPGFPRVHPHLSAALGAAKELIDQMRASCPPQHQQIWARRAKALALTTTQLLDEIEG